MSMSVCYVHTDIKKKTKVKSYTNFQKFMDINSFMDMVYGFYGHRLWT